MFRSVFFRLMICLFFLSFSVYSYLDKQNGCTELMIKLPKLKKEIEAIQEKNAQLQYQIECFENPENLLSLANQSQYAHLKFPIMEEVLTLNEGIALQFSPCSEESGKIVPESSKKPSIVVGAKQ